MKTQTHDFLRLLLGFILVSPVLLMVVSLAWAILTPINVKSTSTVPVLVQNNNNTSIEFSEPLWTFSGNGWVIRFERNAKCVAAKNNSDFTCFRYGQPRFEADFVKMSRPYREAERQRIILEEASKGGQRI